MHKSFNKKLDGKYASHFLPNPSKINNRTITKSNLSSSRYCLFFVKPWNKLIEKVNWSALL